jgi:uncharacterized membrane protein
MSLGPIEVIVVGFPGNKFNGAVLPELMALVEAGTITVVDGVFITKDAAGDVAFVEFGEVGIDGEAAALADLVGEAMELVSDEDVDELAANLEPGSSAAMLVFEHTWAKGFRDAIAGSGGELLADFRVPAVAVEELLVALAELD